MTARIQHSKQAKRQNPSLLDEVLERRMLLYVLAAGATLAGASATQAKVVFTPSHAVLVNNSLSQSTLEIDLNNDGVADFKLFEIYSPYARFNYYLGARGHGNLIAVQSGAQRAFKRGDPIGSGAIFSNNGRMARRMHNSESSSYGSGPFINTTKRFLGVKFLISGQVHYGWIGFRSVDDILTATLGGWAYETEPNKPILAGDRGEEADSATLRSVGPTSLELLAAGHTAVADWRRRIAA